MFCDFSKPMAFFVMVFILFGGCAGKGQTAEALRQADRKDSGICTDSGNSPSEERTGGDDADASAGDNTSVIPGKAYAGKTESSDASGGSYIGNPDERKADAEDQELPAEETVSQIYVDVCGAVNAPGVVAVIEGARVFEAIAKAGGLSENADARYVNQARMLTDGEQVYIPTKEETAAKEGSLSEIASAGQETGIGTSNAPGAAGFQDGTPGMAGGRTSDYTGLNAEGKVNINTADSATLQTLNGIGKTRAEAIILYRETNGAFETIEDIMKVSGIKNALFNKIKDQITVA